LGEEKYENLKEAHNQITKYTTNDLEIKYQVLKDLAGNKQHNTTTQEG
jgi:hypothetical protein